jgi:ATP-dependent DNA ligase
VDGEVVANNENDRASFNLLQHHRTKPHLQIDYPVLFSRTFDAKPADLIRAAKELQLDEGIIAKRKGFCYVPGQRTSAAKVQA